MGSMSLLPAADSKRSALAPTLDSPQQARRSAQLQSPVANGAHEEVQVVLHQIARCLKHDVDAKRAPEAGVVPVNIVWALLLEAVLDDEHPDPEGGEETRGEDETPAKPRLDGQALRVEEEAEDDAGERSRDGGEEGREGARSDREVQSYVGGCVSLIIPCQFSPILPSLWSV